MHLPCYTSPFGGVGKGKNKMDNCPLVQIEWKDSKQPIPVWQHLSDMAENKPISCVSVGYLLQDDDEVKVLAPNMADISSELNIQASGIISIPTGCVTKISKLVEED